MRIAARTAALGSDCRDVGAVAFRQVVLRSAVKDRLVTGEVGRLVASIGLVASLALAIASPWASSRRLTCSRHRRAADAHHRSGLADDLGSSRDGTSHRDHHCE